VSSLDQVPDPEVPVKARTRRWSAAEKSRILAEYEGLGKADKGALLRREGIYSSLIAAWRAQRDQGALQALAQPAGRPPADPVDRENARLRARVLRLEADLDKARRVIEVQGKLSALTRKSHGEWAGGSTRRSRVLLGDVGQSGSMMMALPSRMTIF
jgi:transposase